MVMGTEVVGRGSVAVVSASPVDVVSAASVDAISNAFFVVGFGSPSVVVVVVTEIVVSTVCLVDFSRLAVDVASVNSSIIVSEEYSTVACEVTWLVVAMDEVSCEEMSLESSEAAEAEKTIVEGIGFSVAALDES